jgi:hypothetical protein
MVMATAAARTAVPEPQTVEQPKTLAQKLLGVMERVTYIQKKGWNDFHKYHYASEADVAEAVRAALIAERLLIVPKVLGRTAREVTTKRGGVETVTSVRMEFTVVDCDSDERLPFEMEGDGQDPGDKGIFKATTGCTKYALMKLLHIPTGDDPEGDTKTDESNAAPSPKLTEDAAAALMKDITDAGRSIAKACEFFGVQSLAELTEEQESRIRVTLRKENR